jgi:hypothetical protein
VVRHWLLLSKLHRYGDLILSGCSHVQIGSKQLLSAGSGLDATEFHQHRHPDEPMDQSVIALQSFHLTHDVAAHVCGKLRAALPTYEQLKSLFLGDTRWWNAWHSKTFGPSTVWETLPDYLDRVYWAGTVTEMGFLVSAFGRHCPSKAGQCLPLVDRLVLADDRFTNSLDSLLLTVFLAKIYLDIGQPHRSFLCNRRGISLAQIMVICGFWLISTC